MANHSQRRLILSLRQPLHFYRTFNSSTFRSSPQLTHLINPNFRSSSSAPFSSTFKFATPSNLSQLLRNSSLNGTRRFATRLSDSSSGSNRPPKETIMLEGCDFEHWLVAVESPHPKLTRDEIIDGYVKTLAQILTSEEEARMKIYSVSTRHYFSFSALISEEQSFKLKELPNVRWVLPDSYMDVKNKTYAGEPFINGQAVPYDPKYHETWVRNNEESQRNNSKSRRRQRDPNSRSRSPTSASASSSSNQNSVSASGPEHHASHTSSSLNQTSQSSSLSEPVSQQQNLMGCTGSQNDTVQSFRTRNHSHIQNQALNQDPAVFSQNQNPPSYSHNQPPQLSHMQNQSNPWTAPPSQSPATNRDSQGSHNHSWAPPRGHDIQTQHPSNMQNHPPSMSSTFNPYDPAKNVQNESWGNSTLHQSQSPHPSISNNNSSYDNVPPSASSTNFPNQGQNWAPASGYQSQPPQHPVSNDFSNANAAASAPARGMPTNMQNTDFHGGSMPSQGQLNRFSYGDMPHQSQSPQHPVSSNISNANAPPSTPSGGMPTHMQNTNFHGGSMQPQGQQNGFYRDTPHQYGGVSNGYPSQPLQQQQYQESNNAYRDMQRSNTIVTSPNVQNYHNSRRWSMPDEVQLNSNSRNVPNYVQNNRPHTGYPPEQPYLSFDQEYQNSRNLESSNVSASPQGWNYQNMNPPVQNNDFQQKMPMSHGVNSHQFQDMPRPMQNNEFQHNTGPTAQNVNHGGRMPMQNNEFQHSTGPTAQYVNHGEKMPNETSLKTFQTRNYQERDLPIDTYMYATKR